MMKRVLLTDYFQIQASLQDDKINFELSDKKIITSYPFIGRSSNNNGVVDYVTGRYEMINKGNVITLALDGSTGSTFYQYHDFCSGQNIWKLIPVEKKFKIFDSITAMYCITSIKKAVQNYSYNLSLTKTRLSNIKIILPTKEDSIVDNDAILSIMSKIRNIHVVKDIPENRL